jgi:IS4 transposase
MFGRDVKIFDSTTITLFKSILKAAGRKPKSGKEKGGIKVHTLINADENVPELVWFSSSATSDQLFWKKITFKRDTVYVFDKGYIDHTQYEKMAMAGSFFVTRLQDNATYEHLLELDIPDEVDPGVLKDEEIAIAIRKNGKVIRTITFRKVAYWDDKNARLFEFITNLKDIGADKIASLYKQRWQIETLFKQFKQNFTLKYFLGDNENAIIIQIWCSLIANLLITIIRKQLTRRWSFSNIVSFTRLHLFNYIHLLRFLEDPEKDWEKDLFNLQPTLFSG